MLKPLLICTTIVSSFLFSVATPAQTRWDLPTGYKENNFHTENLQQMADEIDKLTNGQLKIKLHPNGTLFKAPDIKRAVKDGQAQMGEVFISNLAGENPVFDADAIPFFVTSYPDAFRLWQASRPVLARILDEQGVMLLIAVPWPAQGIYVNRPLNTVADMKGLKWRTYNKVTTRMSDLISAKGITVQAADLPKALASGEVDSFLSSSATGVDTKVWESLSYFYTVYACLPKNMLIVNKKAFQALDRRTQEIVLKAAADAEKRGWKISEEKNKQYVETLAKNNMKVITPGWRFRLDMGRIGQALVAEWLQSSLAVGNSDGKLILDNYLRGASESTMDRRSASAATTTVMR